LFLDFCLVTKFFSFLLEAQVFDPAYFTSDHSWSLLNFLFYRQQQSDFLIDKKQEHARYIRNLSNILKVKQVNETIANLAGSALATLEVK